MRILVADDDAVLTHLLESRLRSLGYEVQVTRDALQAWQSLRHGHPDLLLLDINMPGGTGLAVLRRLKSNHLTRGIPVIVMTAAQEETTLAPIRAQHPDGLMFKPIRFEELALEVSRLLVVQELAKAERPVAPKGST